MRAETLDSHPAGGRAEQESGEGRKGRGQREAARSGDGESDEHDIAGHVGDEHPAQTENAHGVDDSRDHREYEHEPGQRAVSGVSDQAAKGRSGCAATEAHANATPADPGKTRSVDQVAAGTKHSSGRSGLFNPRRSDMNATAPTSRGSQKRITR